MKISKYLICLSSILLLNSCDLVLDFNSTSNDNTASNSSSEVYNSSNYSGEYQTIRLENKNEQYNNTLWAEGPKLTDNTEQRESYTVSFQDVRLSAEYNYDLPSVGDVEILVIPVTFEGYSHIGSEEEREVVRNDLAYTFFGESTSTGWESVSSYYYKSSYGKLNISGGVSPWFTLDKSPEELEKVSAYADPTFYVLRKAIDWYKNSFDDIDRYDSNNDKVIDAVWLVYDAPSGYTSNDIWWAFTFWDYQNGYVGIQDNYAYTYAWASYDFMYEGEYTNGNDKLGDAHTFIHETGHILGLDDYYDYDSKTSPVGCLDMMDGNIGDHNSYSKFLMDWADPIFVKGDTSITLRPFESTGDFILINDDWNGSVMDEYLVVEFYTPTGLNQKDAEEEYPYRPKMFTDKGIRIYHVDSRIGVFDLYDGTFENYTDSVLNGSGRYTYFAHSNTASTSVESNYSLIHILDASASNHYYDDAEAYATNSALYNLGVAFNSTTTHANLFYKNGKFNSNTLVNYSIEITSMNDSECTLNITKLN